MTWKIAFFRNVFVCVFLAALGSSWLGYLFVYFWLRLAPLGWVCGLLTAVASPVVEH